MVVMNTQTTITHEAFIAAVAEIALARLPDEVRADFKMPKLVYGVGPGGARGITYYDRWDTGDEPRPFVELCASGEEDWLQLACTTIHELGHVLTGPGHGHNVAWKAACKALGLRRALAGGQAYMLAALTPDIRHAVAALPKPADGKPADLSCRMRGQSRLRPCGQGVGVRGGKSRGAGSGSRLIKAYCETCEYNVRVSRKWLSVAVPECPNGECERYQRPMLVDIPGMGGV